LRLHERFEWDAAKAKANLRKHSVSFDDAAAVLADESGDRFQIEEYDDEHSMDEDRWITTASHPADRRIVLRIVWTPRWRHGLAVTASSARVLQPVRRGQTMKTKSRAGEPKRKATARPRTIRKSAAEIAAPTQSGLARLRAAMEKEVDTSDISERQPGRTTPARRTAKGKLVAAPESPIRDAILRELGRRQITRYELWKRARTRCPTLPESAVYEFLRGDRQIGLEYVDALLAAAELEVRPRHDSASDAH